MEVNKHQVLHFAMSTARRLGCFSRATLNNKTGEDCVVHVLVRREDGSLLASADNVFEISNRDAFLVDIQELSKSMGIVAPQNSAEELLFTFSMVPKSLAETPEPYEIEATLHKKWLHSQDHYVEHFCPKTGFASGVNYAVSSMNDPLLTKGSSNLVQAPKVFLSEHSNTIFQLLFFSSALDRKQEIEISCVLREPSGKEIAKWAEHANLHSLLCINIKQKLRDLKISLGDTFKKNEALYFQTYCSDAGFAFLAFNVNEKTGRFSCEHSLSAPYYFPEFNSARKAEVLRYVQGANR